MIEAVTPEEHFAGHPLAVDVYRRVLDILTATGPVEVRVGRSQVAFRRRTGIAAIWLPGRYVRRPTAEVVLSIGLRRHDRSPRFAEVAHPTPTRWTHHLGLESIEQIDAEVIGWLDEAARTAS